ncbi:MAG: glycosyltransferase family 2 protein [Synergistaceae bacterium]|nr:glycosyltransferase family 2 protein [Synergistaceae bacterium]
MQIKRTDIYPITDFDRRIRSHAPMERKASRRGSILNISPDDSWEARDKRDGIELGNRYRTQFPVRVYRNKKESSIVLEALSVNVSNTGIIVEISNLDAEKEFELQKPFFLRFFLPPGDLPEGYDSAVDVEAKVARVFRDGEEGQLFVAFMFDKKLSNFLGEKRWRYFEMLAIFTLFITFVFIGQIKTNSVFYFFFDPWMYLYGLCAVTFLVSRYFFAAFYWNTEPVLLSPEKNESSETGYKYDYAPPVSIVISCFNEEEWIIKTIRNCLDQYYPPESLEVIVVDDGSTDNSPAIIQAFCDQVRDIVGDSLVFLPQKENKGKREVIAAGVRAAKHDLIVVVDSDSFLTPEAVAHLVQPFKNPKVGAVSGRTEVENKWTNTLTKMQAVRYYIAFRIFKAAEAIFDAVSCLSGPLACYRKSLVLENLDAWLNQRFLWHRATFGDDRSMTNFILSKYRTGYQDKAVCYTMVPSDMKMFMCQQMRWKRSWLRESIRAAKYMWRKEPFAAISFYSGLALPVLAPFVVVRALIFLPIMYGIFPTTFLLGIVLMSLLMSGSYLLLRRSRLWLHGILFCAFYLFILIWQMPVAILTFWKSEWSTRDTAADVAAKQKKAAKKGSELYDDNFQSDAKAS